MNKPSTWIAGGVLALCAIAAVVVSQPQDDGGMECKDGVCKPKTPDTKPAKPKTPPKPDPKPKNPRPWPSTTARYQTVGLGRTQMSSAVSLRSRELPSESFVLDESVEDDKASWVNGRESDGEVLTADFPGSLYMQNIGSKRDGAGMCVMTSITMCARYLGLRDYYGLRDWCAKEAGGAYRQKVDDQIKRYEKAMGITNPAPYLQYEGPDPGPVLDAIDKARLPFAHTYGWSPRYKSRIAHMVANCKYNGRLSVVLDNNPMNDLDTANNEMFEWMTRDEMIRRAKLGQNGNMWIHAWLAPPPPPCPKVK